MRNRLTAKNDGRTRLTKTAKEKFGIYKRLGVSDNFELIETGTIAELNNWARKKGLKFKNNKSIFGGYWVEEKSGETYEFDLIGSVIKSEDVANAMKILKKDKMVSDIKYDWGTNEIVVRTADGEPLGFKIHKNGDLVWDERKIWMGNINKLNTVKKQIEGLRKTQDSNKGDHPNSGYTDEFEDFIKKHKHGSECDINIKSSVGSEGLDRIANNIVADANSQYKKLNDAELVTDDDGFAKGGTEIWYTSKSFGRDGRAGYKFLEKNGMLPDVDDLDETHVHVGSIKEKDLNNIFHMMQGEIWSPMGQANGLMSRSGSDHTSMSVGDIIKRGNSVVMVDKSGFKKLG